MKKLLLSLAALIACGMMMVVETKPKCCKKSCAPLCDTYTEKRMVKVACPWTEEICVPREVCEKVCHTEYDKQYIEHVDYKDVEQTRQVCKAKQTEWICPNGKCCNPECTHQNCVEHCKSNGATGTIVEGSQEVVA